MVYGFKVKEGFEIRYVLLGSISNNNNVSCKLNNNNNIECDMTRAAHSISLIIYM